MTRGAIGALAVVLLTVACSNEPPPQGDVPPLVSVTPAPSGTPSGSPSESASQTPSAAPVETLCRRLDLRIVATAFGARTATVRAAAVEPAFGVPTYSECTVDLAGARKQTVRVGVSVLEATAADLAAARKAYDGSRGKGEAARAVAVGDGGFGTSRFAVFLGTGRLVRISGDPASYNGYLAVARDAAMRVPGMTPPATEVTLPDCERGTAAAAAVLGASPAIRWDHVNAYGDTECGWATRTSAVYTEAVRVANAERLFTSGPGLESVPLGDDGLYDASTHAVRVRIGPTKVAYFTPVPAVIADKNDVVSFALKLNGLYTR
jgi:hypothetical protein